MDHYISLVYLISFAVSSFFFFICPLLCIKKFVFLIYSLYCINLLMSDIFEILSKVIIKVSFSLVNHGKLKDAVKITKNENYCRQKRNQFYKNLRLVNITFGNIPSVDVHRVLINFIVKQCIINYKRQFQKVTSTSLRLNVVVITPYTKIVTSWSNFKHLRNVFLPK